MVAQRVEKLKRSAVVSLVELHQRLAHGNADLSGRLVLEVVSRLPAGSPGSEVRRWSSSRVYLVIVSPSASFVIRDTETLGDLKTFDSLDVITD